MGMDVYGKKPASEVGQYFRNSVWGWRPLARYVVSVAPQITSKCKYWQSNDGDGLNAQDSAALARILAAEIASGRTADYAAQYESQRLALPKHKCQYCDGLGIRADKVGIDYGFPDRIVTEDNHRKGLKGWCNACAGSGQLDDDASKYPFDVENVESFVAFLKECGGFEIH